MNTTAKDLLTETMRRIDGAYAPSTIRAYKANFERFIEFCIRMQASSLPANSRGIANYIAYLTKSGLKSASIRIAIAAISSVHKLNGFNDPTLHPDVKIELKRMHRSLGRSSKQAFGITKPMLEKMISATKDDLRGLRDKALILMAYDSLCRRAELVSIKIEDFQYSTNNHLNRIRLKRSKTDQEGIGTIVGLGDKTRLAIEKWLNGAKIKDGYLFRGVSNNKNISTKLSPGQINRIYKRLAKQANLTETEIKNISGHSIRVGAAQDLLKSGVSLPMLMQKGRWRKTETAMRYANEIDIFSI